MDSYAPDITDAWTINSRAPLPAEGLCTVTVRAAKLADTDPPEARPLSCTRTNEHANQSFRRACNIPDGIPPLALSFRPPLYCIF